MTDDKTTIGQLKGLVEAFEKERDWRQFHSPKNLAMGLSIEAAELMEHFLWLSGEQAEHAAKEPETKQQIGEEMSDVLNYLLCLANVMEIDLSEAFIAKLEKNGQKYPAKKYKGKFKV